uniref:Regulatory protein zeste n=2 Tax=Cacopsylla melanoneura TaxID=428564 RepID=A0A8D8VF12_9HEMI
MKFLRKSSVPFSYAELKEFLSILERYIDIIEQNIPGSMPEKKRAWDLVALEYAQLNRGFPSRDKNTLHSKWKALKCAVRKGYRDEETGCYVVNKVKALIKQGREDQSTVHNVEDTSSSSSKRDFHLVPYMNASDDANEENDNEVEEIKSEINIGRSEEVENEVEEQDSNNEDEDSDHNESRNSSEPVQVRVTRIDNPSKKLISSEQQRRRKQSFLKLRPTPVTSSPSPVKKQRLDNVRPSLRRRSFTSNPQGSTISSTSSVPSHPVPSLSKEHSVFGMYVTQKLAKMSPTQAIYAESIIGTVIKQGLLGKLTEDMEQSMYITQQLARMEPSQSVYADCLIGDVVKRGVLGRLREETELCQGHCARERTGTSTNNEPHEHRRTQVSPSFENDPLESSTVVIETEQSAVDVQTGGENQQQGHVIVDSLPCIIRELGIDNE